MLLKVFIFTSRHGFIWKQDNNPLPVGLLAQLAMHRHREGNGANPLQAWIIFRPYFHYCLSNDLTAKIAFILTSLFSVHRKLYDFHVFTVSALNSFSQIRNKVKFMFLCVYRFRILSWKEKKTLYFSQCTVNLNFQEFQNGRIKDSIRIPSRSDKRKINRKCGI